MRCFASTLLLTLVLAAPASAQEAEAEADGPPPGADEYTQRVQAGMVLALNGDSNGALSAFREAIGMDGDRPQAIYYLASANRLAGNLEDALSGFRQAAQKAQDANEPRWQGRALQGVAETLERMENRFEEAYQAWQEYVRFADSHQAVAFPALGRARVQAYNVMHEQEQAYVGVRQRIAERERANAQ